MGIINFIKRSRRVFKLARYPSRKEMWATTRICILGIIIIGVIAFLITMIFIYGFLPIINPSAAAG
ncbi:MAG: protein translocase SEC61 complex subunit gamma [Candidatus Jordarchaeum sp.]|uniref:protein translocase SEC61 complex subunit gamma n=1 Tax=Candidatus Jordarchaeum sp. TaxID=2823881 RepID=UPI00404B7515